MPISNAYIFNFMPDGSSKSGYIAATAVSGSTVLPTGIENLLLLATATTHFRLSVGASTATTSDPALFVQQGPVVAKLDPNKTYTLSLITDSGSSNVSWCQVMEA